MRYVVMLTLVLVSLPLGCKKKPEPKTTDKPPVSKGGKTIARLPETDREPMIGRRLEPRPEPKPIPPWPEPKPEPKPAERTYIVKKGDTLWGIATQQLGQGKRHKEIMALNGLTSDKISIGQTLKLPAE